MEVLLGSEERADGGVKVSKSIGDCVGGRCSCRVLGERRDNIERFRIGRKSGCLGGCGSCTGRDHDAKSDQA